MNHSRFQYKLTFIYLFSTFSLIVFLYGFFPINGIIQKSSAKPYDENKVGKGDAQFQKLVFLVIDALRYDFVFNAGTDTYMPFTTSSIFKNESCLVKLRARAPTVTLPRVKALTSGMVPTFFDVVANFMASEFEFDSFIHQAKDHGFKIVFYGDETWIKLFPSAFLRSDGTSSFFVSDYTEVDDNVTKHLDHELQRSDWDFLILHYLGLDHIGHMEGPRSALVAPKLHEMDQVILKIYQYLRTLVDENSLFFVTSDHGMRDSGGHGGITPPEVILPLVSIGKACQYLPGWPRDYIAEQIDVASTISVAFGLPIPNNNMGKIIPSLLHNVHHKFIFEALELNKRELLNQAALTDENRLDYSKFNKLPQTKVESLFKDLNKLSNEISNVSDFKLFFLISSILCSWISYFAVLPFVIQFLKPKKASHFFLLLGTCLYGISLTSSSMIEEEHQTWYFFWVTVCIIITWESQNQNKWALMINIKNISPWIFIIAFHRILRKLNQSGDKWAMLPDIKSFLYLKENHLWLISAHILGLIALFLCACRARCRKHQLIIFGSALLISTFCRLPVFNTMLRFLGLNNPLRGKLIFQLYWLLIATFFVQSVRNGTPLFLVWSLVACILFKSHNIILIPFQIITSKYINKIYNKMDDTVWNSIIHIWLGYVFYFYQGNGNSLANVDVAVGFIGVEDYNFVYSSMMIAAHTNFSHIMAFLLSPGLNLPICAFRLILLNIYCTFLLFQLDHLFIWVNMAILPKFTSTKGLTRLDEITIVLLYVALPVSLKIVMPGVPISSAVQPIFLITNYIRTLQCITQNFKDLVDMNRSITW